MRHPEPTRRATRARLTPALTALALATASCGDGDDTGARSAEPSSPETTRDVSTPDASTEPSSTAARTAPPAPTAPTSSTAETSEVSGVASTFPLSDGPCASPAAHMIGGEPVEYTFTFEGEERPVGVRVGGQAALGTAPTMVAILSPPGGEWESSAGLADLIGRQIGPEESRIVVAPQASSGQPLLWTRSVSFNADYLATLFGLLERSFCLDGARVVLGARGGATIAVAQAICATDLSIDLAYFQLGMVTVDHCDPARAVPILSIDRFGLNPPIGPHWEGSWDPPAEVDLALTGGFNSTPDEVATWAEIYECTDEATLETLPDAGGVLAQPTVVLAHRACDAPIVAFGMQPQPGALGVVPDALVGASVRLAEEWNALLGDS